jgi:hypothetical protein
MYRQDVDQPFVFRSTNYKWGWFAPAMSNFDCAQV